MPRALMAHRLAHQVTKSGVPSCLRTTCLRCPDVVLDLLLNLRAQLWLPVEDLANSDVGNTRYIELNLLHVRDALQQPSLGRLLLLGGRLEEACVVCTEVVSGD